MANASGLITSHAGSHLVAARVCFYKRQRLRAEKWSCASLLLEVSSKKIGTLLLEENILLEETLLKKLLRKIALKSEIVQFILFRSVQQP